MPAETVYSAETESTFRLGRKVNPNPRRGLMLDQFLFPTKAQLPDSTDRLRDHKGTLTDILGNDRYGDCVIAGEVHLMMLRAAVDGQPFKATAPEVIRYYFDTCGPGDNGCMIDAVLDSLINRGFNGHKLAGWARFNGQNADLHKAGVYMFGGTTYGINLPAKWANGFKDGAVWDDTTSPSVGGHEIVGVDYNKDGVVCSTWGGTVLVTWAALRNPRIFDECYVSIGEDWLGADKTAPGGLDLSKLQAAMRAIQGGNIPDIDPPQPPTPPTPPGPQVGVVTVLAEIKPGTYALVPLHMGKQLPQEAAKLFGGFLDKIDWLKFAECTALCAVQSVKSTKPEE